MPCPPLWRPIVAISPCWAAMLARFPAGHGRRTPLMHRGTSLFRLTTVLAVSGLVLAQSLPSPTLAQGVPPPPQISAPDQQGGDPPARVGRLARLSGSVSFC